MKVTDEVSRSAIQKGPSTTALLSPLVTARQIGERWGVHRDTIYRISPQELPYRKIGPKTRRYQLEDVLAYEDSRAVNGV